MKIPCPHCGERDWSEFRYGGDASKQRPVHGFGSLDEWHDYVFLFENLKVRTRSIGNMCWAVGNGSS